LSLCRQFGEEMNAAEAAGGDELRSFFQVRVDEHLIERVYGAGTCKVLDVHKLCSTAGRQGPAFWFIEQLLAAVLRLVFVMVKLEASLNGGGEGSQPIAWNKRLPRDFQRATGPRTSLSNYLRGVPIDPTFQLVELHHFPWFTWEDSPTTAVAGSAPPPVTQSATVPLRPFPTTVVQWSSA